MKKKEQFQLPRVTLNAEHSEMSIGNNQYMFVI